MYAEAQTIKKRRPPLWKSIAAFAAVGVLLWAASLMDPTRKQREWVEAEARAASRAKEAEVNALVPEAVQEKGERSVSFSDLAFDLDPADERQGAKTGYEKWLPAWVKKQNGQRIRIEGFMLPTRMDAGGARECLIMANQQACCYGQTPRFCEFIVAKFTGKPAPAVQDRPLVFQGRLQVADVFVDGVWTTLYTLDEGSVGR